MTQYLINGLVGFVQNIIYHSPTGPWVRGAFPAYNTVDFPKFLIRDYHMLLPDEPHTWVPIHMAKFQCEN